MPPKGQSKPRLRASCDGCFLAKVKCSKLRPVCNRCLTVGLICRYSPSSRAGKSAGTGDKGFRRGRRMLANGDGQELTSSLWGKSCVELGAYLEGRRAGIQEGGWSVHGSPSNDTSAMGCSPQTSYESTTSNAWSLPDPSLFDMDSWMAECNAQTGAPPTIQRHGQGWNEPSSADWLSNCAARTKMELGLSPETWLDMSADWWTFDNILNGINASGGFNTEPPPVYVSPLFYPNST